MKQAARSTSRLGALSLSALRTTWQLVAAGAARRTEHTIPRSIGGTWARCMCSAARELRTFACVGSSGKYVLFAAPVPRDMTSGQIVAAIAASPFGSKLIGVALEDCTVFVSFSAKNSPTAAEEAAALLLEGSDTLGDVITRAAHGTSTVFIRIQLPTERPLKVQLPAPIVFTPTQLPDAAGGVMHVAQLPTGPFYLETLAHDKLLSFVRGTVQDDDRFKVVMIVGPIKSGKTAILNRVLPGLRTAQYATDGGRVPVFFQFTFGQFDPPDTAASFLLKEAALFAQRLDVEVPVPPTPHDCLVQLGPALGRLARGIADRGGELCMLLDEVQAPILRAPVPSEARLFAAKLKEVVSACGPTSRIAVTGSGMVSLLNSLREVPVNGYALWDAVARVHVGASPARAGALFMAKELLHARNKQWYQSCVDYITPERVVDELTPAPSGPHFTSPRPALVAYMLNLMGDATLGTPDMVVRDALHALMEKLQDESQVDAAIALGQVDLHMRIAMIGLARGVPVNLSLMKRNAVQMIHALCEPSPESSGALRLLPPYAALYQAMLSDAGTLLVQWEGSHWVLGKLLQQRLVALHEHARMIMGDSSLAEAMSCAVLQTLAANGVGVMDTSSSATLRWRAPTTLAELSRIPAVIAIGAILDQQEQHSAQSASASSRSMDTFRRHVSAPTTVPAVKFLREAGVHLLLWLRHVEAHSYLPRTAVMDAGLRVSLVDKAVSEAVEVWRQHRLPVTDDGVPYVPLPAATTPQQQGAP